MEVQQNMQALVIENREKETETKLINDAMSKDLEMQVESAEARLLNTSKELMVC